MVEMLVKLFIQTFAAIVGKQFAEFLAVQTVCAASKGCPEKVDAIAEAAGSNTKKAPTMPESGKS